jgi:hypothetical protein
MSAVRLNTQKDNRERSIILRMGGIPSEGGSHLFTQFIWPPYDSQLFGFYGPPSSDSRAAGMQQQQQQQQQMHALSVGHCKQTRWSRV